ncbi:MULTISPECIES: hypothetical protein [unclassified Lactococcus]|uniref:hypothetical protein n=1 Tax=unclassified Lactococcus TaxID=2643510 RepID=UPI0011C76784|nr:MULTISPECIES: hypothetical protein [unclassified Lactococcus]MQW23221.1 hypothetical protein [Lactococcus sp. dk101]TXK38109.1 hypothetical protein FVP42_06780 [Lactococcus sp. dk310]TXK49788.1 hypothetical protein FVP43_06750 [Lactococcus sp. dk322]
MNCHITDNNFVRVKLNMESLTSNFELVKLSNKLEKFDALTFKEFLAELKKVKVKLSLKEQDEWEEYFDGYKADLSELTAVLTATDREIDTLVYELYGLTEEEIRIVEGE